MKSMLKDISKAQRVLTKSAAETKKEIRAIEAKQKETMRMLSEAKDSISF